MENSLKITLENVAKLTSESFRKNPTYELLTTTNKAAHDLLICLLIFSVISPWPWTMIIFCIILFISFIIFEKRIYEFIGLISEKQQIIFVEDIILKLNMIDLLKRPDPLIKTPIEDVRNEMNYLKELVVLLKKNRRQ